MRTKQRRTQCVSVRVDRRRVPAADIAACLKLAAVLQMGAPLGKRANPTNPCWRAAAISLQRLYNRHDCLLSSAWRAPRTRPCCVWL